MSSETRSGTDASHDPKNADDARTTDQRRAEPDAGKTGDNDAHNAPAAAPLGADAEAGGETTPREDIAEARRHEVRRKD